MFNALLSLIIIFFVLSLGELLWRTDHIHGEISRKLIHISVGSFIAFWPFYMSFRTIELLSFTLFIVVFVSKYLHIFQSIHAVKRHTVGELLFPVAIGLGAVLSGSKWIFAAAILHMSMADGFAAIIGTPFAQKRGHYRIFNQTKTIIGTVTFLIISAVITTWLVLFSAAGFSQSVWPVIIWLPILTALLENIAILGSDNLVVPLVVILVLRSIH